MKSRYFDPPAPRLYGHRGSAAHFPENTLPSFEASLASGSPYLELDVWATRDGHVVVHHDESALRLCDVDVRIRDCTLSELRELDAGFTFTADGGRSFPFRGRGITIPTLEELFSACPGALFNIEVKQENPAIEDLTVDTIHRAGMAEAVLLAAEKDAVMARLRPLCDGIPTSFCYGDLESFFAWAAGGGRTPYRPPGAALQIPEAHGGRSLVTPETVRAAHALGLEVHVWTVNDPHDMARLLSWGVDGIMSDDPALLADVAGRIRPGGPFLR